MPSLTVRHSTPAHLCGGAAAPFFFSSSDSRDSSQKTSEHPNPTLIINKIPARLDQEPDVGRVVPEEHGDPAKVTDQLRFILQISEPTAALSPGVEEKLEMSRGGNKAFNI